MSKWKFRLLLTGVMAVAFATVAYLVGSIFQPVSDSPRKVGFEVPRRATARQIAGRLADAKLIRHPWSFLIVARMLGEAENLKAGEYELRRNMAPAEIIDKMSRGDAVAQWFTIPEGYTLEQVADELAKNNLAEKRVFMRIVHSAPSRFGLHAEVPRRSLEGYLFPDSYKVKVGVGEESVVRAMLQTFDEKVLKGLAKEIAASDIPLDEVITIAAMIEREAQKPEDRPLIAAVIRNRLARNMPLQIDATVLYALGKHKSQVLLRDLTIDSPYNTYKYGGLPPGPICSPGLSSIEAALHPAKVDYLYYVARRDGSHIFTRTLAEHQAATRLARSNRS
jgi:peptidoglycan lytic transglycosylase G